MSRLHQVTIKSDKNETGNVMFIEKGAGKCTLFSEQSG